MSAIAILAGLSLSACAAARPVPVPRLTCFQWMDLLKNGLIRRGLERSTVQQVCRHFEIPRDSSEKRLCSDGPADKQWDCLVEDYRCDRGDLAPGTVRVIYKLNEGTSAVPAEPNDVPGQVWVVDYCGFQEMDDKPPPRSPVEAPRSGG